MLRASECTGPTQRLGAIVLCPERLLRFAVRRHTANRIVSSHGRDDDVALENVAISRAATPVYLLR